MAIFKNAVQSKKGRIENMHPFFVAILTDAVVYFFGRDSGGTIPLMR
jgi:hypothetical protein